VIGAINRLNVIVRNPAGCYETGMLADIQRRSDPAPEVTGRLR
jgi:hypothetical protein